jgi:very-short-patch-repair endonuclease
LAHSARLFRKAPTRSEELLWEQLRDRRLLGLKFRRQHAIEMLMLDFYCPELHLAIEVDGGVHHSPEARQHDAARDALLLNERGIRTIRVSAQSVEVHMGHVLAGLKRDIAATRTGLPLSIADGEGAGR